MEERESWGTQDPSEGLEEDIALLSLNESRPRRKARRTQQLTQ